MKQISVRWLLLVLIATAPLGAQNRACHLLTADEVKTATGLSFRNSPAETAVAGQKECTYTDGGAQKFSVSIRETGGKAFFERSKALQHGTETPVNGVADAAYLNGSDKRKHICFLKGNTAVLLTVVGGSVDAGSLKELARKAAGRL